MSIFIDVLSKDFGKMVGPVIFILKTILTNYEKNSPVSVYIVEKDEVSDNIYKSKKKS